MNAGAPRRSITPCPTCGLLVGHGLSPVEVPFCQCPGCATRLAGDLPPATRGQFRRYYVRTGRWVA